MVKLNEYFTDHYKFLLNYCKTISDMPILSKYEYKILFYMISNLSNTEYRHISQLLISEETHIYRTIVSRSIDKLIKHGLIDKKGNKKYREYLLINKHVIDDKYSVHQNISEETYNLYIKLFRILSTYGCFSRSGYKLIFYFIINLSTITYKTLSQASISSILFIDRSTVSENFRNLIKHKILEKSYGSRRNYRLNPNPIG